MRLNEVKPLTFSFFRKHVEAIDRSGNSGDPVPARRGSPVEEKLERAGGGERKRRAEQRERRRFRVPAHQLRELGPPVAFGSVQDRH